MSASIPGPPKGKRRRRCIVTSIVFVSLVITYFVVAPVAAVWNDERIYVWYSETGGVDAGATPPFGAKAIMAVCEEPAGYIASWVYHYYLYLEWVTEKLQKRGGLIWGETSWQEMQEVYRGISREP